MNSRHFIVALLMVAGAATAASPARVELASERNEQSVGTNNQASRNRPIPLQGWSVDVLSGMAKVKSSVVASEKGVAKAATDAATVFRPVTPCRLVDTRGNGAPITGGPFSPGQRRTINPNGLCGIPTGFVRSLSVSVTTFNYTTSSGGYIAIVAPGAAITGITDVFNLGSQWSGSTANVPTSLIGAFDVYIQQATADVIIDVNGYYQDLDFIDVGSTELDIVGTSTGELFELTQTGSGAAIGLSAFGGGPAVTIYGGSIRVAGAGVNTTDKPAFIHQVTATCGAGTSSFSAIDHTMSNNDPNAILIITPRAGSSAGSFEVSYSPAGCTAGQWAIHDKSGGVIFGQFNVLIIKS